MEQLRHRLMISARRGSAAALIKSSSAPTLTTSSPATMQNRTNEKNPTDSRASPIKTPETRHDPHSSRLRPSVDGSFLLDKECISPHLQIRHSDYASGTAETQPV